MQCSPGPTLLDEQHSRHARRAPWFGRLLAAAIALTLVASTGCGSRRALVDQPIDSTATARTAATGMHSDRATLGERLGRLDARMRTASADSFRMLQNEYYRLLAEHTGEPGIVMTGGPAPLDTLPSIVADTIEMIASDPIESTTPPATELAAGDLPRDDAESFEATPRRQEQVHPAAEIATGDPATMFRGLRPRELATIPGYEAKARSTETLNASARSTEVSRSSTASAGVRRRSTTGRSGLRRTSRTERDVRTSAASKPSRASDAAATRGAEAINSRGERKALVEGIAAARAGKYSEAVTKLGPSVKAGRAGAEGNYYYALSLEKSGKIDQAASQYLRASKSTGALAHRSYLDYCRLLARSGDRQKARELLTQFLRRNPDSSQATTARRLLQTL